MENNKAAYGPLSNAGTSNYPLEWLDVLISQTLNPKKNDLTQLDAETLATISYRLKEENANLQLSINSDLFALNNEKKIVIAIRRYYVSLIVLTDHVLANEKQAKIGNALVKQLFDDIRTCLGELIRFIENRFQFYVSMDERVPATYLDECRKGLQKQAETLGRRIEKIEQLKPVTDIIIRRLNRFILSKEVNYEITIRALLYKKECLKILLELDWDSVDTEPFTKLDELLVYINFNSKAYINILRGAIRYKIKKCVKDHHKLERLLFYYKAFKQLHRKPGMVLNPKYYDLDSVMGTWFEQEIAYMEKKISMSLELGQDSREPDQEKDKPTAIKQKIMVSLSSDQTGLILRAADDLRIIVAKSKREVFRSIVPHLSTSAKEHLSFDGMRGKSYMPEERDKEIAIHTLNRMIERIKDY
jgi:hypothetical protein